MGKRKFICPNESICKRREQVAGCQSNGASSDYEGHCMLAAVLEETRSRNARPRPFTSKSPPIASMKPPSSPGEQVPGPVTETLDPPMDTSALPVVCTRPCWNSIRQATTSTSSNPRFAGPDKHFRFRLVRHRWRQIPADLGTPAQGDRREREADAARQTLPKAESLDELGTLWRLPACSRFAVTHSVVLACAGRVSLAGHTGWPRRCAFCPCLPSDARTSWPGPPK